MSNEVAAPREKVQQLVVTFPNTISAITMEKICKEKDLPGRLIPVPRVISASCGMAWLAPDDSREILEAATTERNLPVEGWYHVMI